MPYGSWINDLPTAFFMVVHIAAFALAAGFAWLAFKRELPPARHRVLALRSGRGHLHDLPPRLDRVPLLAHDRRGARPGGLRRWSSWPRSGRRRPHAGRPTRGAVDGTWALPRGASPLALAAGCGDSAEGRSAGGDDRGLDGQELPLRAEARSRSTRARPSRGRMTTTSPTRSGSTGRQTTRSSAARASRSRSASPAPSTTSARCTERTWTAR